LKYRIISVGKIREPFYQAGVQEYLKRLTPYATMELVEGLEEKLSPKAGDKDIARALDKEGEKILNMISDNEILVALDIKGRQLSSEALAETMQRWNLSGKNRVNLVVGSSFGIAPAVKTRADQLISLSPLTFLHQMAVLILTEQLYRGFKILKNEPYHK